jgi:cytoskeleton protein RodZ
MQELGDLLRKAREAKGVDLADAEEATRIRARYLEALEYGDEHSLPARVYVEGFVRNYAAYLGLSPQEVMARYRAAHEAPEPEMLSLHPAIHPVRLPDPGRWLRVLVALVLLALLVAGGVYLGNLLPPLSLDLSGFGLPSISLPSSTPSEESPGPGEPTPPPSPAPALTPALTPSLAPAVTPAPRETPTSVPTAEPTATRVPEIRVQVHVTANAWLRVTLDGAVAFEGLLAAGENRTWVARDTVGMLSGNAGGTEVTVDGVPRGSLGAPGQVVELTWTRQ